MQPDPPDKGDEGNGERNRQVAVPQPMPAPPVHGSTLTRVQPNTSDLQVADLQSTLEREREKHIEHTWMWLAASGLLFVMLCFSAIGTTAGVICAVTYLTVITVMGKRWGIEKILETLTAIHKLIGGSKGKE